MYKFSQSGSVSKTIMYVPLSMALCPQLFQQSSQQHIIILDAVIGKLIMCNTSSPTVNFPSHLCK